jgi:adenosine deaminase
VREAGVPITLHAGEADGAERVLEAAAHGAVRIGHGVRLADALADPARAALIDEAIERGLHLEVCPTSNVHTGAYPALTAHPIGRLWRAGIACSFHTDNRLMSQVSMGQEAVNLVRDCGLSPADLLQMTLAAAQASFLPEGVKAEARDALLGWAAAQQRV